MWTYLLVGLFSLIGIGLLVMTNNGLVSLHKPYILAASSEVQSARNDSVAFVDVTVVPMDSERVIEHQTVIVRDGIIVEVGNLDEITISQEALIVDGAGRYLMPGLVDMHVHLRETNELLLYVANGVTTVRNMWGGEGALRFFGYPDHLVMRAQIEKGELFGPTLYTTGPIMEGPPPRMPLMPVYQTPEAAAADVKRQAEQGYDFIKVYDNLDLPTYTAIVQAAQENNIDVVGHVPAQVDLDVVLVSGQVTIEHLSGYIDPDKAAYRIPADSLSTYADVTREQGVWNCPTLAVYPMHVPDDELYLLEQRPEMAYVSPMGKLLWRYMSRPGAMSSITYEGYYPERIKELNTEMTGILHAQGAGFLLGTDANNPYVVPGFSLLDELDYMVEAGLTPYEALEAGTRNAAEAMGKLDDFGTVEEGKRADLILLEANPLEDAAHVRNRAGVMVRGNWLDEAQLQSLLSALEQSYKPTSVDRIWPLVFFIPALVLILRRL